MCGIAGIFDATGRPVSAAILKDMTDVLRHRGPDGEGFWVDSFVGFGHRRLAILDLSSLGHQPMQTETGRMFITYNGEVYNYQNLRLDLQSKGRAFVSKTDTEVVLKSFEQWGRDSLPLFNGMFAFAVWDKQTQTLTLARDRFGIKPLYYYFKEGLLVFGSEIKALLQHPAVAVSVSLPSLFQYFTFQNIFSSDTLFQNIFMLPPAHFMQFTLGQNSMPEAVRYWNYPEFGTAGGIEEAEAMRELDSRFQRAVESQLVSDVEVGCYLSGGIDSGGVASIAARSIPNLKSFTCGFDLTSASGMELAFDERNRAEYLSGLIKSEHYEIVLKAGDMERIMPDLVWHLEDLRVGQSYPNFYVARLASKFVKVALSGIGGDEIFAGYCWRYPSSSGSVSKDEYLKRYFSEWCRLLDIAELHSLFRPEILEQIDTDGPFRAFCEVFGSRTLSIDSPTGQVNNALYFELNTFLHGLLVVEDKMSMAHGLETRVPFLDNELVDFALRLPLGLKLQDLKALKNLDENLAGPGDLRAVRKTKDGKRILRETLGRYVPGDYPFGEKQGFSAPDSSWFRGESIEYIKDILLDPQARIYEFMNFTTSNTLLNEHFSGKRNRRLLIWSLLCFEWWNRTFRSK